MRVGFWPGKDFRGIEDWSTSEGACPRNFGLRCMSQLVAQGGHHDRGEPCPLLEV